MTPSITRFCLHASGVRYAEAFGAYLAGSTKNPAIIRSGTKKLFQLTNPNESTHKSNPSPHFEKYSEDRFKGMHNNILALMPCCVNTFRLLGRMALKTFFAGHMAYKKALNTFKNIDHQHTTVMIDKEGTERVLTFDDLNGYTEWHYPNGTICLALVRMEAKFGPRYAALELRLNKLYLLDVDPEIIDLTIEEPAPSSSTLNTPEKTPKKRQRDPSIVHVDSL